MDLWSLDECHFQQHGSRYIMWVPPEQKDPVLLHAPTREKVSLFGAVRISNGQLITALEPVFSAESFLEFLRHLYGYRYRGKQMVLILDNSKYHHAKLLDPWLAKYPKTLHLDFLPPYSPELNPIERVWKLTRRLCTHNQYFSTLEMLIQRVTSQFVIWKKPNGTLHSLCAIN